ncbi:hypothetical protein HA402_013626 [Bradysia odoriphaga]|nr:hypothetical protein HA402_013626 [Bradysia odoriphaga]
MVPSTDLYRSEKENVIKARRKDDFLKKRSTEEDLLQPGETNTNVIEPSKQSPEKHDNEDASAQNSLLEEKNDEIEIKKSTDKGVFHQALLTGAVLLVGAAGGMPIVS